MLNDCDILLVSELWFLFLKCLKQLNAVLGLIQINRQQRYQFVKKNVSVGEETYEHGLLERIKHHRTWFNQFLYTLSIDNCLFYFFFLYLSIHSLYRDSSRHLVYLCVYGIVPLLQVLAALASYRPFSGVVFKFEAVLVPAAGFQLFVRGLQQPYPGVLQRYQVEILVLGTSGIFLIVVQLLSQKDKLSLFESVIVQRFLVKITFTLI